MPFVFDHKRLLERPIKKRKLNHLVEMAGSSNDASSGYQWQAAREAQERSVQEGTQEEESNSAQEEIRTSSREELIECIKRGQKPTWVPKPGLQALHDEEEALQERRKAQFKERLIQSDPIQVELPESQYDSLSPAQLSSDDPVEKARSALHRGDFSEPSLIPAGVYGRQHDQNQDPTSPALASFGSSPPSWLSSAPVPTYGRAISDVRELQRLGIFGTGRHRAPSLGSSLSSSFVMRTPTSPLVHATNNPYLDLPQNETSQIPPGHDERSNRRRTLPPQAFHSLSMSPLDIPPPNFSRPLPQTSLRREYSLPYQTHQARRSLTSFTYQARTLPQTPSPRARRLSAASDATSRRRTSMVGSFEESILRGRMSTPPSKPLDFVAQIGVMGKGNCPPSLQCPAHVSVSFPAVFYNYPAAQGSRSLADDAPSPYVGTIDLENNLKPVYLDSKRRSSTREFSTNEDLRFTPETADSGLDMSINSGDRRQSSTSSSGVNIGGAYRVPKQGQLQIIIKNPNKTAVKLFLVPYDLGGMEAGTKTFVRQRSFSSGGIIENALMDKTGKSTAVDPLENKLILRYLIHLKFCCPSKGRYYLHESIRVVFANRVPDGKEKLRNEIQLPDPKYSTYKPGKQSLQPKGSISSPTTPNALTPSYGSPSRFFGDIDGLESPPPDRVETVSQSKSPATATIPFHFLNSKSWRPSVSPSILDNDRTNSQQFHFANSRSNAGNRSRMEPTLSPVAGFTASSSARVSPVPWSSSSSASTTRSFSPAPVEAGDGLLSRQFRELNGQYSKHERTAVISENVGRNGVTQSSEEMPTEGDIGLARAVSEAKRDADASSLRGS